MMRTLHLLAVTQLFALALAMPAPVVAQTGVSLAPFGSVELRNGGELILRHGPIQRVTLLKGSLEHTSVTIAEGGNITYWGDARVESSVRSGGAVTRGTAAEADKPLRN